LIAKGAAPVFYFPKGVSLYGRSRAEWLDELGPEILRLRTSIFDRTNPNPRPSDITPPPNPTPMESFLEEFGLKFLKPFDETAHEDDPHNYYMEREWRAPTNISFMLDDIWRVILPETFKARLRQNVPGYMGQITFV
jgi:hypothetical protein